MAGHTKWSEIKHKASPERRAQIDAEVRALFNVIKPVVDAVDPEGLLALGAPADEYDSEVTYIAEGVRTLPQRTVQAIEDIVFDTWQGQFEPLVEGNESAYRERLKPLVDALARVLC